VPLWERIKSLFLQQTRTHSSDARRRHWSVEGPHIVGQNIHHFILDPRDGETLLAAARSDWWGPDIQRSMSADMGDPVGVYFGTETGELFQSRDEGRQWHMMADLLPPILSVEAAVV
jgi:hypothetical protein